VRYNKLLNQPDEGSYKDRCNGKTTAEALELIALALKNQGQWVSVRNKTSSYGFEQARGLLKVIQQKVEDLGLQYFEFRNTTLEFRSNIYDDIPESKVDRFLSAMMKLIEEFKNEPK
jgi:hypothetical protein